MDKLLIKNGKLIDPKNKVNDILDLYVENGKIKMIEKEIKKESEDVKVIDAKNLIVTPGFIDMHVHFRVPGDGKKENLVTGSKAALKGGVTSVATMPNTNPVVDNKKVLDDYLDLIKKESLINIYPIASVTYNQSGKKIVDFDKLNKNTVAFSDDGMPIMDKNILKKALNKLPSDSMIISHCEDFEITKNYKDKPWPKKAEYKMVKRNIDILDNSEKSLHIAHISCKESLDYIKEAKEKNKNISCEITPHHFSFSTNDIDPLNSYSKVNPPIRNIKQREYLIDGIKKGDIDVIASDHAPHSFESKNNKKYKDASYGISGIEIMFQLAYNNLVLKEGINLEKIIAMLTYKPANLLNIDKGSISIGDDADLTLIDLESYEKIDRNEFLSKGKNHPIKECKLKSKIISTIVGGKVMYKEGKNYEY
ncbi:MAG: dihydroorotase [Bacillota bacterium]